MASPSIRFRVGLAAVALSFVAFTQSADASGRPTLSRAVERFDVKARSGGFDAGGARTRANAPTATVRSVVTDYGRYSSFITRFEQARIVGRSGKHTDVYLEVPILKGAGKVWAVVRFSPPETRGDQEFIRGRLVKGNVKRLDAVWRITKIDDKKSELALELLIVPDLPAPKSLILRELRNAAGRAVNSARSEAERRAKL